MTSSVQSPADVVNLALAIIGYPRRVASLYDGTEAAAKALDVYAETRDEVLRAEDWPFALRQSPGVASASALSGYAYSWATPAGCLRVRSVAPAVIPVPNWDPSPPLWTLFNDGTAKLIATQLSPITINYVGQVTDPAQWEPLFVNALAQALAQKLAPSLIKRSPPAIDPASAVGLAVSSSEARAPDGFIPSAAPRQPHSGEEQ